MSDQTPCDCSHARELHDDSLYACSVMNCECLAFLPFDNPIDADAEVEEEEVVEPYQQDPDWWKP